MRRYDVVSGILLVLCIIDFALAAPVPVQEKRRSHVNAVHAPKDVIAVFGKRVDEELGKLGKLAEEHFETSEKPAEPLDAPASPIPTPPGSEPGHATPDNVKASEPNPASSPAHPDTLVHPNPTPTSQLEAGATESEIEFMYGSDAETSSPDLGSDHGLTLGNVPQLNTNKRPLTGQDEPFPWEHWMGVINGPNWKRPKLASSDASPISIPPGFKPGHATPNNAKASEPNSASPPAHSDTLVHPLNPTPMSQLEAGATESEIEFMYGSDAEISPSDPGSDHGLTLGNVPQLNTNKRPLTGQDEPFPWDHWMGVINGPDWKQPKLASSKEFDPPHYLHAQQSNPWPLVGSPMDMIGLDDLLPPLEEPAVSSSQGIGQAHNDQAAHAEQQPNSEPLTNYMIDLFGPDDRLPSPEHPGPSFSKEFDQAHEDHVAHVEELNTRPLNTGPLLPWPDDPRLLTEPESWEVTSEEDPLAGLPNASDHVVPVPEGPPQSPELTDPELHSDHQLLSTEIQQADVIDAIYKAKGKEKVLADGGVAPESKAQEEK